MLTALLLLALAPVNTHTFFADYVLNVPVRIENMRNVSSAYLSCDIYHFGSSTTDRQALGNPGGGRANITLTDGGFNGTVSVTVTVSAANALRYTPNTYGCSLVFLWRNPDGTEFNESFRSNDDRATAYTRITGQDITQNTTEITGPLPSS
jgi:hypothetical protein